jgi:hypothetical protein
MASEMDKLDPVPDHIILESGLRVQLESLKTRQFFKLLRIITHSALPNIGDVLDLENLNSDEFMGRLLSIVVLSIPDAEDETIDFIRAMCYPAGLVERRKLNKQDVEHNTVLWEGLDAELENPELTDMVSIIEAIIRRESADIQALGKRLGAMLKLAEKTGQLSSSPSPKESTSNSSAGSAGRSTSSRRGTDGPTTTLQTSLSDDSGNASPLSESVSTMRVGSSSNG